MLARRRITTQCLPTSLAGSKMQPLATGNNALFADRIIWKTDVRDSR
ncbi:MAG: hypothetical protein ABIS36_02620 [Chryseolinea sp.]